MFALSPSLPVLYRDWLSKGVEGTLMLIGLEILLSRSSISCSYGAPLSHMFELLCTSNEIKKHV